MVNAMILFLTLLLETIWLSYLRLLKAINRMPTLRWAATATGEINGTI